MILSKDSSIHSAVLSNDGDMTPPEHSSMSLIGNSELVCMVSVIIQLSSGSEYS